MGTPEYHAWYNMIARCHDPEHPWATARQQAENRRNNILVGRLTLSAMCWETVCPTSYYC